MTPGNELIYSQLCSADSVIRIDPNLTLVEIVERFDLDTEYVRRTLLNKKENIDLLLAELSAPRRPNIIVKQQHFRTQR